MRELKSFVLILWAFTTLCWLGSIVIVVEAVFPVSSPTENFVKLTTPPNDYRSYKGFWLRNQILVLLIHDPKAVSGAVALSVSTGTLDDPKELPGLTNLLGALLLLGSKKHSKKPFSSKFKSHSKTTASYQMHSAEIEPIGRPFYSALERFASYFIDPLLDEASPSTLENIILSEEDILLRYEDKTLWKIKLVERSLTNREHPNFYLTPENKNILYEYPGPIYGKKIFTQHSELKKILHDELEKSFCFGYRTEKMTVVVLGGAPLREMEKKIAVIFEKISNSKRKRVLIRQNEENFEHFLWNPGELGLKIYMKLNEDNIPATLRINFPTIDVHKEYKTAPQHFISYLIEHPGSGGLVSSLQKRCLCQFLYSHYEHNRGLGHYTITCTLTDNGMEKIDDIIELIFQYITLVKGASRLEMYNIFKEIVDLDKATFDSKDYTHLSSSLTYVEDLVVALQDYPFEDIHSFKYASINFWDPSLIENFIDYLRPNNMNITIVSDKPLKAEEVRQESWFGTHYKLEKIDPRKIVAWTQKIPPKELQLPTFEKKMV